MNKQQFTMLSKKLIQKPEQREALDLHMMQGMTAYAAEVQVYGRTNATVSKNAKRMWAEHDFMVEYLKRGE